MSEVKTPWLKYYEHVPAHLNYPDCSISDMVFRTAEKYPNDTAFDFFGKETSYKAFAARIDQCAKALVSIGIKPGDHVTICMPNTPQAVIMFYGLNRMGAIPNMIHPLSSEGEIAYYLNFSESVAILTLNQFYNKIDNIRDRIKLKYIIIAEIAEELPTVKSIGFRLTSGRKLPKVPETDTILLWKNFMAKGLTYQGKYRVKSYGHDPAAILYSGGTTGTTKGIVLTNLNFNALGMQTAAMSETVTRGDIMLALMPIFHGFGLGVCVHTAFISALKCILIPQFSIKTYPGILKKYRPNYIAGVPTLFEALLRSDKMKGIDLSCLKGVFSGGDSLSIELKHKVDAFLKEHGATEQVREGFGLTECVTASCLTPRYEYREGSIGIPMPDMIYKIVAPHTRDEVPYGTEGEIVISGPTVMMGYMNNPKETALTLQEHADGLVWLHTGDLGIMDEDGFIYFKQRLKRMIVTSGYNVYPSQLENIIDAHEAVLLSTVIGVKDDYKGQKIKAFIVLKDDVKVTEEVKQSVIEHCKKNIAKYALPYEYEFRSELPKTLVGKVAFKVLEAEEEAKIAATEEETE